MAGPNGESNDALAISLAYCPCTIGAGCDSDVFRGSISNMRTIRQAEYPTYLDIISECYTGGDLERLELYFGL